MNQERTRVTSTVCVACAIAPSLVRMAIKYTRPEPPGHRHARESGPRVRMLRYSAAPPTRRALTWIIVGTALAVTLLMIVSELSNQSQAPEYSWIEGVVISNEANVLRLELPGEDPESPEVYDVSVKGHPELESLASEDAVRIQVETDTAGAIARIIRVEAVETPIQELPAPE